MKPTIGRQVWYFTKNSWPANDGVQPLPASICYVWDDSLVSVGGFDRNGMAFGATSIPISPDSNPPPGWDGQSTYVAWMPYQVQQTHGNKANTLPPTQIADG